jgi:F0F1-type ATP synthase assembly protein I
MINNKEYIMSSFDEINKKIEDFRLKKDKKNKKNKKENILLTVSCEIFTGILFGGVVGLMLDSYFAIKPIMFLICLIFGIASSFLNIYNIMIKKKE